MKRIILLCILILSACAPLRPEPMPPPVEVSKETLFEQLERNAKAFRSLKGMANIKVTGAKRTLSGAHALFVEKPASLRAETMSPFGFGLPVMLAATDGRDLTVFVPSEETYYRGEATPENLMRIFPVPMRVEDLVRFLLYDVPLIMHESADVAIEGEDIILTLTDLRGVEQRFRFDRERRLLEMGIYAQGQILFSLKYASFEGSLFFPKVASLEMPPQQVKASVVYSDITLNTDIPDDKFLLSRPEGIEELTFP